MGNGMHRLAALEFAGQGQHRVVEAVFFGLGVLKNEAAGRQGLQSAVGLHLGQACLLNDLGQAGLTGQLGKRP